MADQLKVGEEVEVITRKVGEAKPDLDSIITSGIQQATAQAKASWEGAAANVLTNQLLPQWEQKAKDVVRILDDLVDTLTQVSRQFAEQNSQAQTDLHSKYAALGG